MTSTFQGLLRWLAIVGAMTAGISPLVQAADPEPAKDRPQYTKQEIWNGGVESFQYFTPNPSRKFCCTPCSGPRMKCRWCTIYSS